MENLKHLTGFSSEKLFTMQIPNCQQIPHTIQPLTEKILNRKKKNHHTHLINRPNIILLKQNLQKSNNSQTGNIMLYTNPTSTVNTSKIPISQLIKNMEQ
jgi:hypothetical protein